MYFATLLSVAPRKQLPQPAPDERQLRESHLPRERADLAVRIAALRLARGWNWNDLAREAGVKSVQIRDIERGTRDPGFTTLVRLAKALELSSLDQLLRPAPLEV